MTPAFLSLLAMVVAQGGAPGTPSGIVVEGKQVNLDWPTPQAQAPTTEIAGWRGWSYLNGSAPKFETPYLLGYDWSAIRTAYETAKAVPNPVLWHTKVVILERWEAEFRDPSGVLRFDRRSTPDRYLTRAQEAVARFCAWVTAETQGKVRIVPDVSVEHEVERTVNLGPDFARAYFGPRINGGGYEAEDKVFRGPYQSAFYITPEVGPTPDVSAMTWVNGTPVSAIPLWDGTPYAPGQMEHWLHESFLQHVGARLRQRGDTFAPGAATTAAWSEAASTAEVPTATLLERLAAPNAVSLGIGVANSGLAPEPVYSWKHEFDELSLVADNERGQVLRVTELGAGRNSGVALPSREDKKPLVDLKTTPVLSFWIRTTSMDAIGLKVVGENGKSGYVSLGRETLYRPTAPDVPMVAVDLKTDGAWQRLNLNLQSLGERGGFSAVQSLQIEPTPLAMLRSRRIAEPIVADFDDFRFTNEAPTPFSEPPKPSATSTDPEERALFAAKATATGPELLALLGDRHAIVRLNAADAFTRIKDEAAMPALQTRAMDVDPTVGAKALQAVAFQGGDAAWTFVRRMLASGLTPYTRETAARLLGSTKDPKYGADFRITLTDSSRLTRAAAAEALAQMPSKENSILQMAFLMQEDPEITLRSTLASDSTDEYQMRKLLWSAVNEPSDLVRAASDAKLISSNNPTFRAEGYKGVRDDSFVTRLLLLDYLTQHPDESHRGALRIAVTDRSAAVRAAALRGFGALEKGVQAEEIANVLEDRNPKVQLALIELAKKRGFALSEATRRLMAESPDPEVRKAISELKG